MHDDEIRMFAWAEDFIKALDERPFIIKILLRFLFGKYAYSEFLGMVETMYHAGYRYFWGYGLEGQEYHHRPLPLKWWEITRCTCNTCKAKENL